MAKIEIFSGSNCQYCEQAKAFLKQNEFEFIEYDIAKPAYLQAFQERLPRTKTIPQIFVNDEHIGNDEDLRLLIQKGQLAGSR